MCKIMQTVGLAFAGLLGMFGTRAEAHYMYVSGRYYYHSVGCQATIGSLPSSPSPLAVGCVVATVQVESLCPDLSIVSLPLQANLLSQVQLAPGQTQADVSVADNPLLNPVLNTACGTLSPLAVLIRNMAPVVSVFQCAGLIGDPCLVLLLTSSAASTCALPAQYSLSNYPNNLPPVGTEFTCSSPLVLHVL